MKFFTYLLLIVPLMAFGQVPFPPLLAQSISAFTFEAEDWGIAPISSPKASQYHGRTPTSIPGARVIKTLELKGLLEINKDVVVVDVLDSKERMSIRGAYWMSGAGDGRFFAPEKERFAKALDKLTGGDKNRPVVFLCVSSECWLSYNASLHAIEAGYKDIIWFRGGTESWRGSNQYLYTAKRVDW